MSLDELAQKYGTDKSSQGHNYCRFYEKHLPEDPEALLELGVAQGASLRMWREYFPQAKIVGVDQDTWEMTPGQGDEVPANVVLIDSLQDDPGLVNKLADLAPFDVIIDDCSHLSSKTAASFTMLWPLLAPGGLYVVEDYTCGDEPEFQRADDYHEPTTHRFLKGLGHPDTGLPDVGKSLFYFNIAFIWKLQ